MCIYICRRDFKRLLLQCNLQGGGDEEHVRPFGGNELELQIVVHIRKLRQTASRRAEGDTDHVREVTPPDQNSGISGEGVLYKAPRGDADGLKHRNDVHPDVKQDEGLHDKDGISVVCQLEGRYVNMYISQVI